MARRVSYEETVPLVGLQSHLRFLHGVYTGDVHTMAGLVEAHECSHADPDRLWMVDHEHEPEPPTADPDDFWS